MIDEQSSRGSAAALDPASPVLEPAAPALEPAALADPSAPRTQPGTRGQVNEEPAPASSLTQPGTRGQVNEEGAQASSMTFTQRLLAWVREFIQFGLVGFALGTAFRFYFYHYVVFTGGTRA